MKRVIALLALVCGMLMLWATPAAAEPGHSVNAYVPPLSCNGGQVRWVQFQLTGIPSQQTPPSITIYTTSLRWGYTERVKSWDGATATYESQIPSPLVDGKAAAVLVQDGWAGTFRLTDYRCEAVTPPRAFIKQDAPCGDMTAAPPSGFTLYIKNDGAFSVTYDIVVNGYAPASVTVKANSAAGQHYTAPTLSRYSFTISYPGGKIELQAKVDGCKISEVIAATPTPSAVAATSQAAPSSKTVQPTKLNDPRNAPPAPGGSGSSSLKDILTKIIVTVGIFIGVIWAAYKGWKAWRHP